MNEKYKLLREQLPHGNAMFPLMIHDIESDCSFKERVGCHWHEEIEILVVTKGMGEIHIDNRSYSLAKDTIVFIPSNHLHSMTGEVGISLDFFAVVFDIAFLNSFVNDVIQQQYFNSVKREETVFTEYIIPTFDWERRVLCLLLEIRELFEKKETAYELSIKAKLYAIWHLLYVHSSKNRTTPPKYADYQIEVTKSIIAYIKEHYESSISLTELSKRFNLSVGHLCRFFKSMTKMSVVEYINYYRISISAELLKETGRDIGEIAVMTGFNNISYYNKTFRKYMHMTPSKFRQMIG
ncbi:AraC family transcriptional regulator [Anaerocolumna cellulosilytica]|uniref:AraC family transcriptional regulator n=1 Tax=Anaerocolumna cellulosilytica TaxID=433286 RepID=A0A6S6QVT1_9FIRM|nr:AraC family transcriptional regulator [Anaerocolumna cellulosilytica]MBB5197868.1 AraC-like DNA-binding protein [Anaerocolumna cellulosilytica]BCJ93179.1 AraC family transcriptional regulator [Anaerocolumna cellulosilytica]